MFTTYRIPSKKPYGFVEIQDDGSLELSDMMLQIERLEKLMDLPVDVSPGLSIKEWNAWIDRYMTDGKGSSELYDQMSDEQKGIIQAIKLSMKRLKAKNPSYGAFYDLDEGNGPGKGEAGDWSNQD